MAEPLDLARSIVDALLDQKVALSRLIETEGLVQQWIGGDAQVAQDTLLEASRIAAYAILRLAASTAGDDAQTSTTFQPHVDRTLDEIIAELKGPPEGN